MVHGMAELLSAFYLLAEFACYFRFSSSINGLLTNLTTFLFFCFFLHPSSASPSRSPSSIIAIWPFNTKQLHRSIWHFPCCRVHCRWKWLPCFYPHKWTRYWQGRQWRPSFGNLRNWPSPVSCRSGCFISCWSKTSCICCKGVMSIFHFFSSLSLSFTTQITFCSCKNKPIPDTDTKVTLLTGSSGNVIYLPFTTHHLPSQLASYFTWLLEVLAKPRQVTRERECVCVSPVS